MIEGQTPEEKLNLILVLSFFLLLLYSDSNWYVQIPITILVMLAFIFPQLRIEPKFWFIITTIVFFGNFRNWYIIDNHKHLLAYWCLSIFLALLTKSPFQIISKVAKALIAFVFLLAVLWKLVAPDFINGSFFEYSILFDDRFKILALKMGGVTESMMEFNEVARSALTNYDSRLDIVVVKSTPGIKFLSKTITWWAIILESVIAIAFLLPAKTKISKHRDFFLITFIILTYPLATVIGFGWLLIILGLSQYEYRFKYIPVTYIALFILLQVYRFPWNQMF